MRCLIVDDSYVNRVILQRFLAPYGQCTAAGNGREAVDAFRVALDQGQPFDLICMDIMMPQMDGHESLRHIRDLERERGLPESQWVKAIMTTALADADNVRRAGQEKCQAYLLKPIGKEKLIDRLKALGLLGEKPNESADHR